MSDKLIVTFDKSAEDVPVLIVAKESWNYLCAPSMNVINTITGENAEKAYRMLTERRQDV